MHTYREPIGRFVVEYLEDLPEEHKAQMRLNGIDPDDNWLLEWSFEGRADAEVQALRSMNQHEDICADLGISIKRQYRVRDRGENAPRYIERVAMF